MKYLKTLLFLFVLLLFSLKAPLVAAQEMQIMPPIRPDDTPILGQEHAYSVLFRGNGDAVISMRAAFTNEGTSQTNVVSFRIPRVEPRRVSAFQILREPQCVRYETTCVEYQEPNYFQWYGQAKYQRATTGFSGDTLTITLPQPIKPNKSGSVLLVFSATGYTKKDLFGAYSYAFETFKVESASVSKATIGVSVDSDLVLAGAKGKVNYRFSETDALSMAAGMEKMAAPNSQLDQMYSQVGYGTITKNVSHLEPLESYTVRGRYADSILRLYAKHLLIGLGIVIAAVVVLVLLGKRVFGGRIGKQGDVALLIGGSFAAAALIAVYTAALFLLRTWVQQMVSYDMVGIVFILITIVSIGVYGFLLVTPAILVGIRRGMAWGLGTFGLTVLFLVINAVIMVVTLILLNGNGMRPTPIYNIMKGGAPGDQTMVESTDAAPSPR